MCGRWGRPCDDCGNSYCKEHVYATEDPVIACLCNTSIEAWLCFTCTMEREDDIYDPVRLRVALETMTYLRDEAVSSEYEGLPLDCFSDSE